MPPWRRQTARVLPVDPEGRVLLLHGWDPHHPDRPFWFTIGGAAEAGESLRDAGARELREETGWDGEVSGLLRIISRPDRPHEDRQNVAFDFVVTPLGKVGEPDDESMAVEWIPIESLPAPETMSFDHGETVQRYLKSRGRPGGLPFVE